MRKLSVAASKNYDILIGNGLLPQLGGYVKALEKIQTVALISETTVYPLFGQAAEKSLADAGFQVKSFVFPAGEASKCADTYLKLLTFLAQNHLTRTDAIVALGGGVVGDLAGFVASIYYRGIPFMQIPTTVVAQVDSSVGGKTAVNIPEGKNLAGAFHQPAVVVIDPTTLVTLDRRTLAEGLAEAAKHAAIRDASMLHELKGLGPELSIGFSLNTIAKLPDLIARNVAIKARIVENDELETLDIRALLNFGHTIGHGIEAAVPYGTILHGEAVALGMRAALFLSERKAGLSSSDAKKILCTLQALELPLVLPDDIDTETVLKKTASDKKFRAGTIRFVLLSKAGEAGISKKITREDMAEAIEELRRPLP